MTTGNRPQRADKWRRRERNPSAGKSIGLAARDAKYKPPIVPGRRWKPMSEEELTRRLEAP